MEQVVEVIKKHGPVKFSRVCVLLGISPGDAGGPNRQPAWRAVDRDLQKARRKGLIRITPDGWVAA